MKNFKILQVSIDFLNKYLIISLGSGASPSPPTNACVLNFLYFPIILAKISIKFEKIFKNSQNFL